MEEGRGNLVCPLLTLFPFGFAVGGGGKWLVEEETERRRRGLIHHSSRSLYCSTTLLPLFRLLLFVTVELEGKRERERERERGVEMGGKC